MTKQILIVDDDTGMISVLETTLKKGGHEVLSAMNAHNALTILDDQSPDLMIIDIMMPGMDGLDLCKQIRKIPEFDKTPIIILTARTNSDTLNESDQAGADLYLIKPFLPEELLVMVNRLLM